MPTVSIQKAWEGNNLAALLAQFNEATSVTPEGAISFSNWGFEQGFSLLDDVFRYPETISAREMSSIIRQAVLNLRKSDSLDVAGLQSAVNALASMALSQPRDRFIMLTQVRLLSASGDKPIRLRYRDVGIRLSPTLPRGMKFHRQRHGYVDLDINPYPRYCYAVFQAQARNGSDAAKLVFDASDILMSVININWREWNIFGGEHHSEAKVWQGPNQFLWKAGEAIDKRQLWFDPAFREDEWKRSPKNFSAFQNILPRVRKDLKALESHPLRLVLVKALKQLHDGMVSRETSYRLLRFWSALETMFSRRGDNRTDLIIERSLFADEDFQISKMKLKYLSSLRNDYVHAGLEGQNVFHLVQFLRDFVARHVLYVLRRGSDFSSHEDYLEMCKLPRERDTLRLAMKRRDNIANYGKHRR